MKNFKTANLNHPLITAGHLKRKAIIYVRQSTREDPGNSRALCESQIQLAQAYGWPEHLIEVVDRDPGYQRMLADIANNTVGILLPARASRLSRNLVVYERLQSLAADHATLVSLANRIIDPSDRLGGTSNEN